MLKVVEFTEETEETEEAEEVLLMIVAMIFIDCCKYNNRPVGRAYY